MILVIIDLLILKNIHQCSKAPKLELNHTVKIFYLVMLYSLYRIIFSDLDQQEGLLTINHVDTIITVEFIRVFVESILFA